MNKNKEIINTLKRELMGLTGNKVYYRDLESLFKKIEELELDGKEISALRYLSTDIRSAKFKKNKNKNNLPFF